MIRLFNIFSILALLGSAVYAYSIKYETMFRTEQIAKCATKIQEEKDAIGMLRAEWALLRVPSVFRRWPTIISTCESLALHANRAVRIAARTAFRKTTDRPQNSTCWDLAYADTPSVDPAAAPATPKHARQAAIAREKRRRPQDDDADE